MQLYLDGLSMTMRSILARLTIANPQELDIMGRYPMGWVDETGAEYTQTTGKRIRPLLMMLCTEAVGGGWRSALPAAAAVEFLHNFSLVHDDIQDHSFIRHGRPTVWKIWGVANAINIGDELFVLAYAALDELALGQLTAQTINDIRTIFSKTNLELIRGQYLDMRFETQLVVTVDDYLSMIAGKSAALIAACAQIGALIGCQDARRADEFAAFGLNLGLAFQIRDDILGIWGQPEVTGKSAATDILTRKKSLPVLYGLSKSAALVDIYQNPEMSPERVSKIIEYLDQVGAYDYTKVMETTYYDQALQALARAYPHSNPPAELLNLANQLLGRSS